MTAVKHLSMRVPWRDQPWDEHLCTHPLDNSSCILLKNIGDKRDDNYEVAHAGEEIAGLERKPPCLSERGTFMSDRGYRITKTHPYSTFRALDGHLHPTALAMPAYSFEGVPFRWLARKTFEEEINPSWRAAYDPDAEDRIQKLLELRHAPTWIMDGRNQQSVIRAFFDPVAVGSSLIFIYLKHSPFQDENPNRLLVGAAHVSDVQLPAYWKQSGKQPFDSSMWETAVVHSLRPDQKAGILLPYQQLLDKQDAGADVSSALAWAPDGKVNEFSYVTDHVSSDTAIDALASLRAAADGCRELGIDVPRTATEWVDDQVHRLWDERGSTPGLASVLAYLQVEQAYTVARVVSERSADAWQTLEAGFNKQATWPVELQKKVAPSVGLEWRNLDAETKTVLKLLSAMDVRPDQVALIMELTSEDLGAKELLADPYLAAIWTYDDLEQVSFNTVDRALFPPAHVTWDTAVPTECRMAESRDPGLRTWRQGLCSAQGRGLTS